MGRKRPQETDWQPVAASNAIRAPLLAPELFQGRLEALAVLLLYNIRRDQPPSRDSPDCAY